MPWAAKKLHVPEEERLGAERSQTLCTTDCQGEGPWGLCTYAIPASIKIIPAHFCHTTNTTESMSFYKYISNKRTYLSLIEGYTTNTN